VETLNEVIMPSISIVVVIVVGHILRDQYSEYDLFITWVSIAVVFLSGVTAVALSILDKMYWVSTFIDWMNAMVWLYTNTVFIAKRVRMSVAAAQQEQLQGFGLQATLALP